MADSTPVIRLGQSNIRLTGVTRTDNARLEVRLEGEISIEAARAVIAEVFENLRQPDFGKVR